MELKNTEKQEHSVVALTIDVTREELEAAKEKAFKKKGKNINVPGFRRGKAPRRMIEKLYGEGVFFEEAFNILFPDAIDMAVEKSGVTAVGRPDVELLDPAEEGGLTFVAKLPVEPEVELGEYKGVKVEKTPVKVLASDVKAEIERMTERFAKKQSVERKAKKKDTLDLDFEGFVDGVAFEGGSAEHHMLTLGSGAFIPGFEDQLIGIKAGEAREVTVTFPEDYHASELAGKEAVFKCKVHKVVETIYPELDDEFAKDISDTCETLDDLKKEIKERLVKEREMSSKQEVEQNVLKAITDAMTADIPNAMIESQIDALAQDFAYRLQMQGMSMEQYAQMTGGQQAMRSMFREEATRVVKNKLALKKIAALENIAVSDKDLEDEYAKLAEDYRLDVDKVKGFVQPEALKEDIKNKAALELVCKAAKVTDKKAAKAEEKAE